MKKWQIENSEKSEIPEKLFQVSLFPSFRVCPTAKIENSDLKFWEKNFQDFRDFSGFRVFDLALHKHVYEDCNFFFFFFFEINEFLD